MTDLWTEATRDAEAEEMARRVTAARISAVETWPFLAGATSESEYENRKALVADRLDAIVSAMHPNDPVAFSVVRSSLEASLDEDFQVLAEQRRAEEEVRQRIEARLAREAQAREEQAAEEEVRKRIEANLQREAGDLGMSTVEDVVEHVSKSKGKSGATLADVAFLLRKDNAAAKRMIESAIEKGTVENRSQGSRYSLFPKTSARTATRYCPTHKVYVGEGNQENHDHCPVETRKKKESAQSYVCPYCDFNGSREEVGKHISDAGPEHQENGTVTDQVNDRIKNSSRTAALPQKDPATQPEEEAEEPAAGQAERRLDQDPDTGEFVGSEWVEKEGDPDTLVQSDTTFGKNPRFKTEEEGQQWVAEGSGEAEDTTKPDAAKTKGEVPAQFEKKNTAARTADEDARGRHPFGAREARSRDGIPITSVSDIKVGDKVWFRRDEIGARHAVDGVVAEHNGDSVKIKGTGKSASPLTVAESDLQKGRWTLRHRARTEAAREGRVVYQGTSMDQENDEAEGPEARDLEMLVGKFVTIIFFNDYGVAADYETGRITEVRGEADGGVEFDWHPSHAQIPFPVNGYDVYRITRLEEPLDPLQPQLPFEGHRTANSNPKTYEEYVEWKASQGQEPTLTEGQFEEALRFSEQQREVREHFRNMGSKTAAANSWVPAAREVLDGHGFKSVNVETNEVVETRWHGDEVAQSNTDVVLDPTTANMLLTVHDALTGERQERFATMPLIDAVDMGWKLVNRTSAKTANLGTPEKCAFCDQAPVSWSQWLDSSGNQVVSTNYYCSDHEHARFNWAGQSVSGSMSHPPKDAAWHHTAPGGGTHAPYRIEQDGDKWKVVNDNGETKGTHDSKEEAREHQKALYANVEGASEQAERKSD